MKQCSHVANVAMRFLMEFVVIVCVVCFIYDPIDEHAVGRVKHKKFSLLLWAIAVVITLNVDEGPLGPATPNYAHMYACMSVYFQSGLRLPN